ncbi:MAG: glycosyltransferase [candidate division WOR-3 bacterium]
MLNFYNQRLKVLIISYYAPPLGLSGVLRVTKFCKYLPDFGIEPIILTCQPISYYYYDPELLKEIKGIKIYRAESFDPARIFFLFFGKKVSPSRLPSPDFFFPDSKIGFLPFAYNLGRKVIQKEKVSLIFATAPPWTVLLLGVSLKRHFSLPLISDFRDPWPQGFIPPRNLFKKGISSLLQYIVKNSDAITLVQERIKSILGIEGYLLPNGYDLESEEVSSDQNNLFYAGNLFENEKEFFSIIQAIQEKNFPIRLDIAGAGREDFIQKIRRYPFVNYLGILTHKEVSQLMRRSSFLLYISKPNQEAGIKLYEYLGAKRPIIYLGPPDTEAERIIKKTDSGITIRKGEEIKEALKEGLRREFQFLGVEGYSFHKKAERLAEIMRKVSRK